MGWPVGGCGSWPHPGSVVQDPLGRWGRGELLPWWPVCRKFLPGEAGDIYTQGQAESGQAAEGRRAGTVWAQGDHWLRCVRAGGAGHVMLGWVAHSISTCVQRELASVSRVGFGTLGPAYGRGWPREPPLQESMSPYFCLAVVYAV